jgi:hypothetical protein
VPYLEFYVSLLLAVVLARVFYRIGEQEYGNGWIPCLMSVAISMASITLLPGGIRTLALLHALLFLALWAYNYATDRDHADGEGG